MRTLLLSLLAGFSLTTHAQDRPAPQPAPPAADYHVAARGPHERVWQRTVPTTNATGHVTTRTNSYTELATGLHYWDAGQWKESQEVIESHPGGAIARQGPHKVIFGHNLNTAGAIDMETPNAKRLQSHVLGLSYFDVSSGQSILIAELKDCEGQIVNGNQVIYPDAFTDLSADVRYTYTKAGFEQDIILREQPPSPAEWGLNPDTTRLQVLTEFLNPAGKEMDLGVMALGQGRAFDLGAPANPEAGIPVQAAWTRIEGRQFLIEDVEFLKIQDQLEALPPPRPVAKTPASSKRLASLKRHLPQIKPARSPQREMKLAQLDRPQPGFVLDYTVVATATDVTFRGDTTYYVNNIYNMNGITTLEGGTVIKYTNSPSRLQVTGRLVCKTDPYRPAFFVAKDDNTVGETIPGSTGNPGGYYASRAIYFSGMTSAVTVAHLRIRNAQQALFFNGSSNHVIAHCQILKCDQALGIFTPNTMAMYARNVLIQDTYTAFQTISGGNYFLENLTLHSVANLSSNATTINLTNSLLVDVTNHGSLTGGYNATNSGSGIFSTNGAGYHYLAANSLYRNAGTTNINATLLADLRNRTTYPPLDLTNTFTTDTTLSPQAQRDTDTPDLGYHYDPIDYFSSCIVSNATLTLTNGVALAYHNSGGIWLQNDGRLVSTGSAERRNYLAYYGMVQEQPTNFFTLSSVLPINLSHADTARNPDVSCRFTTIIAPQRGGNIWADTTGFMVDDVTFQDCELYAHGAYFWLYGGGSGGTLRLRNNLFHYAVVEGEREGALEIRNNLFYGGGANHSLLLANLGAGTWTWKDNAFELGTVYLDGTKSHNAYATNTSIASGVSAGDLTNCIFNWQTGPLGRYYQPTNSPLINTGSTNAHIVGLYHYTAVTNLVKETNSMVDIGYHYVATDANGIPTDTDGDGWPDYLEDANGNGTVNSGEIDWQSATDLGFRVWITRPAANLQIP